MEDWYMRYIELFAGIGGFRYGLESIKYAHLSEKSKQEERTQGRLGTSDKQGVQLLPRNESPFRCVYANEFNKYAASIYERRFNDKPDTRDITTVPAEEIPDHELLVGGFPCQAFSIAGKRGGFEDTRGTLFFEIARIAKQKQPRLLLLENVKGLLSHDQGRTFGTILHTLSELGYDCEWQVLNSKDFGVPQNRERVFIIGHLRGTSRPEVFPIGGTNTKDIIVRGILDTETWRKRHEQIRRVHSTDGISPTIPTGTGGGVMTKIAIPTINPDREDIRQSRRFKEDGDPSYTLVSKFVQGVCIGQKPLDMSRIQSKVREDGLSSTITATYYKGLANQHRPGVLDTIRIRRLTPTECERLQGFPDGWTSEGIDSKGNVVKISDTQRYKTLGNAVTTNVITAIGERLI